MSLKQNAQSTDIAASHITVSNYDQTCFKHVLIFWCLRVCAGYG